MIFLIKHLYPKAHALICVSNGIKDELVKHFNIPENLIFVIYNPIDIPNIQSLSKEEIKDISWFDEDIPIVINVSRLERQKGLDILLSAFAIVRNTIDCRLVILGKGRYEKFLKQITLDLKISGDVVFLGYKENPFKYISRCTIFVLSSLYEGFSLVLTEAMACGIPVISTDCPYGPSEIIEHEKNGILVPVGDVNALANAMLRLLQDKQLRSDYALKAFSMLNRFSVDRICEEYKDVFNLLINKN